MRLRNAIIDYAHRFATYLGSRTGRPPDNPAGLEDRHLECIARSVGCGLRAGVAMRQHDQARATLERDHFRRGKESARLCGIKEFMEECYSIGYRGA